MHPQPACVICATIVLEKFSSRIAGLRPLRFHKREECQTPVLNLIPTKVIVVVWNFVLTNQRRAQRLSRAYDQNFPFVF